MGHRREVSKHRPRLVFAVVSAATFLLSFVAFPQPPAFATVGDKCAGNFPSQNEVVPCIGVKGSGLYVEYADIGAMKLISPWEAQTAYAKLGWIAPGAAISDANLHVLVTTPSKVMWWWYPSCAYWYVAASKAWTQPKADPYTCPNSKPGWGPNTVYNGSFSNNTRLCVKTWAIGTDGLYHGSYYLCVTIHT